MRIKKKHLVVMIPCFNEEKTLPLVIRSIPKKIPGISKIETLVVDDGSTDKTYKVAKKLKVNHIIRHINNKGLACSFTDGMNFCIEKGYDIIVNTDGDNQYPQQDIPRLIKPILEGKAEIVIADRQVWKIKHFSLIKKILQKIGSWVVKIVSGVNIPDAASGFRARSREAAIKTHIFTDFSYVIETIIQAAKKKISITWIPIKVNPRTRESRLFKNNWGHIKQSAVTIIRVFAMYDPLKFFSFAGGVFFFFGLIIILRFIYIVIFDSGASGHIQSLIVASILIIIGFQIVMIGIVADLIASNRKLHEEILYRLKNKPKNY